MKKRNYALFIALFIITLCLGKNVYASDGISEYHFDSLLTNAQTIGFNNVQVATEQELDFSYGTSYKFYVPTTMNVTITVTYDKKADLSADAWLMDINNEHLIKEMSLKDGKRNGSNYNVTTKMTCRLRPGYYILGIHTRWSTYDPNGAITYTKITGSLPTKPTITKLKKRNAKSAILKWNRIGSVSGYQIYRKVGTRGKYSKIKTTNATSFVNNKLQKKKIYYYKIRAYKNIKGQIFYTPFSSIKKIKIN